MLVEHRADEMQRAAETTLVSAVEDVRALYVLTEAAKNLERSADSLMHCALAMRDHVLGRVMTA